ncbi:magnesium chelatase subunit H [Desulfosoma sp.]
MASKTLTFVVNAGLTQSLWEGFRLFANRFDKDYRLEVFTTQDVEEDREAALRLEESLKGSQMVFLDIRGGGKALGLCGRILPQTSQPVVILLGGSPDTMRLLRLGSFSLAHAMTRSSNKRGSRRFLEPNLSSIQKALRIVEKVATFFPLGLLKHMRNWIRMVTYWNQGGPENIAYLLAFAAKHYLGERHFAVPTPVIFPDRGIYDPLHEKFYTSVDAYRRANTNADDGPIVGLLFYGGMHFSQSLVPTRALAEALQRKGMGILPVFAKTGHNLDALRGYFLDGSRSLVDAVVYLQWFQLVTFTGDTHGAAVSLLKEINAPIFAGCPMYGGDVAVWEKSERGLSPVEVLTTVILPELDGMIEPIPTAGLMTETGPQGERFKKVVPLPDRVQRASERIGRWAVLRRKSNEDKRIAFIIYDTPPGEDNLGSAAYLDTFQSLERLFREMHRRGYRVSGLPKEGDLAAHLLRKFLVNSPRWVEDPFRDFGGTQVNHRSYGALSVSVPAVAEVQHVWGPPPGQIMAEGENVYLPVVEFGNVLLGVQPVRGFHEDPDKISHDKTLPPHHQYVAFYRWLEEVWKADCIVHVGTHGTLEFLKGKEVGVSRWCFPEALIGNVPHLYFYHAVNASEAAIAKRRSLGVLINYNSPPFAVSGLYGDYEVLEKLIEEYLEAATLHPQRAQRLEARIFEQAKTLNLDGSTVASLQEELALMKRSLIPQGLHILGETVKDETRIDFATFFTRYDRDDCASLHRLIAESKGLIYEDLLAAKDPSGEARSSLRTLEEIEDEVRLTIREAYLKGVFPKQESWRRAVSTALKVAQKLDNHLEYENFFRALSGGYVEPGLGGDALRNPEVLPTGRNSYPFDPRLVPSEEAMRRGFQIAENTLAHYRSLHGRYPQSVAVVLWGFETTKTRGETVGQILGYLGVRIQADSNPYHKKLAPMPLSELGRPRIDCLVQICGFFRDMYPNVLDMLHRAFHLVSQLDEPQEENFVRAHSERNREQLRETVEDEAEREHLAVGRIFGPRAGEYGTRLTSLIETGAWKDEADLVSIFISSMQHLYGGAFHGQKVPELYRQSMQNVELVSQIRDSHEYEIMDLDHYYEFFGGLSRSVESMRGAPPVMLITDTTREILRTETVGEALQRGVRTRLLNPKWIEALLEHPFHGAQKIADRVEYLIGFAATTHAVENWVWSRIVDRYVRDEELFQRMTANNRFAVEQLLARLVEAKQRGYWEPTDEEWALLEERYLQLEGHIEEKMDS